MASSKGTHIHWNTNPHGMGEIPKPMVPIAKDASDIEIMTKESTQEIEEVDFLNPEYGTFAPTPPNSSNYKHITNEIAETVKEANDNREKNAQILSQPVPIPVECRTFQKTETPTRRNLVRPGGKTWELEKTQTTLHIPTPREPRRVNRTPLIVPPPELQEETKSNDLKPIQNEKELILETAPENSIETTPTEEDNPLIVRKVSYNPLYVSKRHEVPMKERLDLNDLTSKLKEKPTVTKSPVENPSELDTVATKKVTLNTANFSTEEIIELCGKKFLISMLNDKKMKLRALDHVEDFREIVQVGQIIQLKTMRLVVLEVSKNNMRIQTKS